MGEVQVSGLRLAYQMSGDGPPLVLLHGGLTDSRTWHRQFAVFARDYTVVAWDTPGCGRSSVPHNSYRLPDYADRLAELIDSLGLEGPHILGHSFGAGLAIQFYERYPAVPRSLILAAGYAGWSGSLPPEAVEQRVKGVEQDMKRPPQEVAADFVPGLFTDTAPPELVEETIDEVSRYDPEGSLIMVHAFADADLRPILPTIAVPTLLLYGDEDTRSPRAIAQAMQDAIPDARLRYIPDAGHSIHAEKPEEFNREVLAFLRSV